MADPMRIRANVVGDSTEVKVLMNHEMETGQRKDAAGKTIPAWYIQEVSAQLNGKTVLNAEWGPSVAKNPFLQFNVKGAKAGDKIGVAWVDNKGDKGNKGDHGQLCAMEQSLARVTCPDAVPPGVRRHTTSAISILDHAASSRGRAQAHGLVRRALKLLRKANASAARAAKENTMSPSCAEVVASALHEAQVRAEVWLGGR